MLFGTFKLIRRTGSSQICQNVPGGSVLQNEAYKCHIFGTKRPRHLILDSYERSKCVDVPFCTFSPILLTGSGRIGQNVPKFGLFSTKKAYTGHISKTKRPRHLILVSNERP